MPAGGKPADGDFFGVQMQGVGVAAQIQNGSGGIQQRLIAQRRRVFVGTVIVQNKGLVACLQKLHGNGVGLALAAIAVAAAGENQHGGAGGEGGHFGGRLAQVADQPCAGGQGFMQNFHRLYLVG